MTREEEIKKQAEKKALEPSRLMHPYAKQYKVMSAYEIGFIEGAVWADAHPHWISVDDELPKIGWTMSDTVVVTDGNGGLRLAWYHQDEGWHFATGLTFEPTHWMPLPEAPHHFADVSQKVKKGGEE